MPDRVRAAYRTRRPFARLYLSCRQKTDEPVSDLWLLQKRLDRSRRLAQPVFVLHQPEAHVSFPERPEADARRDSHQRLLEHQLGEFQGTQRTEPLRNRRPDEPGPARPLDMPTR